MERMRMRIVILAVCAVAASATPVVSILDELIPGGATALEKLVKDIAKEPADKNRGACRGCGKPRGPAFVQTPLGTIKGTRWDRVKDHETSAFLGIPYAVQKRFEKSRPIAQWNGLLDATERGPACPQGGTLPGIVLEDMSEDCLFANVFAPSRGLNGTEGGAYRPVLFWLHGGGLTIGSAYSQALGKLFDGLNIENIYDGQRMAAQGDVVVISVNYRLGVLGFTPFEDSSGNLGFLDQQVGLRWAKTVAHSFGGDPDKITIFGESAGGTSVLFHLASPLSKGLFQSAIVESGDLDGRTLNETRSHGIAIAKKLDCPEEELLSCMKSKSYQDIIKVQGGYSSMGSVGATIDATVLPASMHELFSSGKFNKLPTIIGNNLDEASIFGGCKSITKEEYNASVARKFPNKTIAAQVRKFYPVDAYPKPRDAMESLKSDGTFCRSNKDIADMTSAANVPTFRYRLVRSPWFLRLLSTMFSGSKEAQYCLGVPHAAELVDVWGTFDSFFADAPEDLALSNQVVRAWTNFAHSGHPDYGGAMGELEPKWIAHSAKKDTTYILDAGQERSCWWCPKHGVVKARNEEDVLAAQCPILLKRSAVPVFAAQGDVQAVPAHQVSHPEETVLV